MNASIKKKAAGWGAKAALKTKCYAGKYKPGNGFCQPMPDHFSPSTYCLWITAPIVASHAAKEGEQWL